MVNSKAFQLTLYIIFNRHMDPQACLKCAALPEDILMLSCNHDLCLRCAAERLSSDRRKGQQPGIVCQFCGKRTELDSETLYELEKVVPVTIAKTVNTKKDFKENSNYVKKIDSTSNLSEVRKSLGGLTNVPSKYTLSSRDENISHRSRNNTTMSEKVSMTSILPTRQHTFCQNHPEEEVLYYCFQCNCECICPECVIHGAHNSHEVQTIKKSYPTIKSYLNTHLQNINKNVDQLNGKQTQIGRSIDEATTVTETTKRHIQKGFSVLIDQIRAKQKEILSKCDAALGLVVQGYKANKDILQQKIKERKEAVNQISSSLMKDELSVLNYYAVNSASLEAIADKINISELLSKQPRDPLLPEKIAKHISEIASQIDNIDIDPSIELDKVAMFPSRAQRNAERSIERQKTYERIQRLDRFQRITEKTEPAQQLKPTYQPQGIQRYVNRESSSSIGRQLLAVPSRHEL